MKKYFLFGCVVLFFFCRFSVRAQQPLNLDFEKASIEGARRPWGWEIESPGNKGQVGVDSSTRHRGHASLVMQNTAGNGPLVSYTIEPLSFAGKQVMVNGWVRSGVGLTVYLIVGYERDDEVFFDTVKHRGASAGWESIQATLRIPLKTKTWSLKLSFEGKGKVWFDDISISVNGKTVTEAKVAPVFTATQEHWIRNHTRSFQSVQAAHPQSPPSNDLSFFGKISANATIIAAGESTHGTSEFFRLKHALFAYTVTQMGVRVFAIEDNQAIVERVNRYVSGGAGTARSSMNGMFSVWQNKEVEALIQWIRDYNDLHKDDMISFAGFDMQHLRSSADSLHAFLKIKDKALHDSVVMLLKEMVAEERTHFNAADSSKHTWWQQAEKAYRMIAARQDTWLSVVSQRTDSTWIYKGIQYANLVRQYARNLLLGHFSLYRDTAMAENISWLLSQQKKGTRIFVWAHDVHISRGEHPVRDHNIYYGISMGAHLSKRYGQLYKAFGISSYTGAYWGQVSYSDFRQTSCPLLPAPRGTLDEALHRVALAKKKPLLFLDLSDARAQSWFTRPIPVRFANHVNIEYGYWTRYSIPYQFDGIFFIDVTKPAGSYAR